MELDNRTAPRGAEDAGRIPPEGKSRMLLKFWGVRGTTPTPGPEYLEFGGNTACVEVRLSDGRILVLDGGTGVRRLGRSLMREFEGVNISLQFFLSHFHWDHIQGIPFFAPLYSDASEVTFHSLYEPEEVRRRLEGQMLKPYFPVDFDYMSASREFVQMNENGLDANGLIVRSFPMNHPQGACGYRLEYQGASVVYASDLEHGHADLDSVVRKYAQGADVLIYDAQFTPKEYERRRNWGHSTWLEATEVARDAGVKQLILIHHDPEHVDSALRDIVKRARDEFEFTDAATEGQIIAI